MSTGGSSCHCIDPLWTLFLLTNSKQDCILVFGLQVATPNPRKPKGYRHELHSVQIAQECSIQAQNGAWDCMESWGRRALSHGSEGDNRRLAVSTRPDKASAPKTFGRLRATNSRPDGSRASWLPPAPDSLPQIELRLNPNAEGSYTIRTKTKGGVCAASYTLFLCAAIFIYWGTT